MNVLFEFIVRNLKEFLKCICNIWHIIDTLAATDVTGVFSVETSNKYATPKTEVWTNESYIYSDMFR